MREAIGLKQETVAKKIGVTRPSYADLEPSEARGSISLSSVTRAADAMDCELVYFLVPRDAVAKTFGELAFRHDPAMKHLHASEHSMALGRSMFRLPQLDDDRELARNLSSASDWPSRNDPRSAMWQRNAQHRLAWLHAAEMQRRRQNHGVKHAL